MKRMNSAPSGSPIEAATAAANTVKSRSSNMPSLLVVNGQEAITLGLDALGTVETVGVNCDTEHRSGEAPADLGIDVTIARRSLF